MTATPRPWEFIEDAETGTIRVDQSNYISNLLSNLYRQLANDSEQALKDALIAMGWTPPGAVNSYDALVAFVEAMRSDYSEGGPTGWDIDAVVATEAFATLDEALGDQR